MIKKLENTESTYRPRRGFQHVSQVVERLIRIYEQRAEWSEHRERESERSTPVGEPQLSVPVSSVPVSSVHVSGVQGAVQATFGWD